MGLLRQSGGEKGEKGGLRQWQVLMEQTLRRFSAHVIRDLADGGTKHEYEQLDKSILIFEVSEVDIGREWS